MINELLNTQWGNSRAASSVCREHRPTVKSIRGEEARLMGKEVRTVRDSGGVAILEIVKENDAIVVDEADDMDRQITFPASLIPTLIAYLEGLK
jgi:hypothetical protein